jgi:hypothetical protein
MRTRRWTDTSYPAIRRVMGPERERMDDAAIEDLVGELFPEADVEDVENFMRTVQSFGKQVAPLAQRALPGIIQGAATGGTVAGPWGALAGAIGGGAASLLSSGGSRGAPPARAAAQPPAPPPAAVPPAVEPPAAPGAPAPIAPPAAPVTAGAAPTAQLMALLSRPETMQALLSMLMAGSGRSTVSVGAQPVPAPAFANAISELAGQAAEHAAIPAGAATAGYLVDAAGQPRCDMANPAERASLLLADIAAVALREAADADASADDSGDVEWVVADDAFAESDPLEGYEAALEGRQVYG